MMQVVNNADYSPQSVSDTDLKVRHVCGLVSVGNRLDVVVVIQIVVLLVAENKTHQECHDYMTKLTMIPELDM